MSLDPSAIPDIVSQHDIHLDHVPVSFFEGFMLGNGNLGAMLWFEHDRMVLSLDKADIWERRANQTLEPGMNFRKAVGQARAGTFDPKSRLFDRIRPSGEIWGNKLPVGRVEWQLPSIPTGCKGKVILYNTALSLEVCLVEGVLHVEGYLHAVEDLVSITIDAWGCVLPSHQVRAQCFTERSREIMKSWRYPDPRYGSLGQDLYVTQVYSGDEQYAILARQLSERQTTCMYTITVVRGKAEDDLPAAAAGYLDRLERIHDLYTKHSAWWAGFWTRSSISIPDKALERLWYTELYKLGCNARKDGRPVSCMGIWNPDWRLPPCYGDLHHNLETEMNYWPIFAGNHLELAMPLYDLLVQELPRFEENCRTFFGWEGVYVPANMDIYGQGVGFMWFPWNLQVGVGAWLAQHFWLHYLYSGDNRFLREKAWPFMEGVGRFWLGFLEPDDNAILHVPWSYSPEYGDPIRKSRDSAFDLSLVRYLFTIIPQAARELGIPGEAVESYSQALKKLSPLPVDETGIQVYAGEPLAYSHRHFSHLMSIHPLGFLNVEGSDDDRDLIDRSMAHLRRIGTGNWAGWSFAWAALLACRARRPNMAHAMLRFYTDHVILPNTMHVSVDWKRTGFYTTEHGLINTLEAGTGAAAAVMEMLLQSWGNIIRVFPCIPDTWNEASFSTLRAEGAFLVSADFAEGSVSRIHVRSEAGNICTIQNPGTTGRVTLHEAHTGRELSLHGEVWTFPTQPGREYVISIPPAETNLMEKRSIFEGLPHWD